MKSVEMILRQWNPQIHERPSDEYKILLANPRLSSPECSFIPFYFNAWENDHYDDPLCPLLSEMASQYDLETRDDSAPANEKIAAVLDIVLGLASNTILGANASGLLNAARTFTGKDVLENYRKRNDLRDQIVEAVDAILLERADRLVLFVDELDRCNPIFAIRFLEQTKRLFKQNNVIMVFSVDSKQLADAIAGVYGSAFDGTRYLERFFDSRFELTPADKLKYLDVAGYEKDNPFCYYVNIANEYVSKAVFSMRDLNRVFIPLRAGLRYVEHFASSFFNDPTASAMHNALLPSFIVLSYLDPMGWKQVREGADFRVVFELVEDNRIFWKYTEAEFSRTSEARNANGNMSQQILELYITRICVLLFADDQRSEEFESAWDHVGRFMHSQIDPSVFRLLEFPATE